MHNGEIIGCKAFIIYQGLSTSPMASIFPYDVHMMSSLCGSMLKNQSEFMRFHYLIGDFSISGRRLY